MDREDTAGGQTMGVCMQRRPGPVGPGTPRWSPARLPCPRPQIGGMEKAGRRDYNTSRWDGLGQIGRGSAPCASPTGAQSLWN